MSVRAIGGLVVAVIASLGCARHAEITTTAPAAACAAGDSAMVRDVVYFGRNRPGGGGVSDSEWYAFLDEVVTPKFPAGLTVVEAVGRWRGATGVVEQERTEIMTLLHDGSPSARQAVSAVGEEYKRRFRQEAVLRERVTTCALFE
jgi:hypothetical protein